MSLIKREDALLLAIDFQEKLMPAMAEPSKLEDTVVKLAKGIQALNIPVPVSYTHLKKRKDLPYIGPVQSTVPVVPDFPQRFFYVNEKQR